MKLSTRAPPDLRDTLLLVVQIDLFSIFVSFLYIYFFFLNMDHF